MHIKKTIQSRGIAENVSVRTTSGFTFIEIVLVVGITLLLAVSASPLYTGLYASVQLNENAAGMVQAMRTAREWSVARLRDTPYGVFFEINADGKDRYIIYQGVSYAARDGTYDRIIVLDKALSLSTTLSGNEINFSRGLGIPNTTGAITLTHETSGTRTITVNELGKTEEE